MAISLLRLVFWVRSRSWGARSRPISWAMIVVVSRPLTSPSMLLLATAYPSLAWIFAMTASTTASTCVGGVWKITTPVRRSM
jgi:hypothetical protein